MKKSEQFGKISNKILLVKKLVATLPDSPEKKAVDNYLQHAFRSAYNSTLKALREEKMEEGA